MSNSQDHKGESTKLIDILHHSLEKAGYEVERDSWIENSNSTPPNDKCSWLDVRLPHATKEDKRYTVHFYFTENSTTLEDVRIFKSKKKTKWTEDKVITNRHDKK